MWRFIPHRRKSMKTLVLEALCLLALIPISADAIPISKSDVHLFSDGSTVAGATTTLTRSATGATMTFHSSGFSPKTQTTILFVIFNHPENCAGPSVGHPFQCGATDLGTPSVEGSIVVGPTHLSNDFGGFDVGAHLKAGDTS